MGTIRLEVHVDDDCFACSRSLALAAEVGAAFPDLDVRIVGLQSEDGGYQHLVAAVPTYILNGRVVSLGNPTLEALSAAIRELLTGVR